MPVGYKRHIKVSGAGNGLAVSPHISKRISRLPTTWQLRELSGVTQTHFGMAQSLVKGVIHRQMFFFF